MDKVFIKFNSGGVLNFERVVNTESLIDYLNRKKFIKIELFNGESYIYKVDEIRQLNIT